MADLITHAVALQSYSLEANTAKNYEAAWVQFNDFLEVHGLTGPYSSEQLVLFIAWLEYIGLAPATIQTRLDGVKYFLKKHSWPDLWMAWEVELMIKSLVKLNQERLPITVQLLQKMC